MSAMMVQTKCKLNNTELSSNCSIFSAEKLETTSTTKKQQNLKNGKVRFRLNIEVRKEMEDSRLNALQVRKRSTELQQQLMLTLQNLF